MRTRTDAQRASRRSRRRQAVRRELLYLALCAPGLVALILFNYVPLFGVVLAFKNFRPRRGIWGSENVGFDNFAYLFAGDAWRITRNTVAMNALFIVATLVVALTLAILINELRDRSPLLTKVTQSAMFLPFVLSWVVVAHLATAFLDARSGLLNQLLDLVSLPAVNWYAEPSYWPAILTSVDLWKGVGFWVIVYLAGILAINPSLYEAASLDGASRWQQTRRITLPLILPLITINVLLSVSKVFNADFGLFFQVTQNSPALYPTTDVIDTYVYRALTTTGDVGMAAAAGLYQAVVGLVLVVGANWYVRRRSADNALF
ncbi:ABC transporter permease [Micromonospora cathayae]|uniref:ABC transporter permease subunit n=1 Tax=Micromonospora cathayae TaxID=3028804 RepID=A0ABY7ZZE5_9ACTN|nr:ABC transporter permease subunit [Micromonospora sp. HUAS 3]WDZ87761.1 ABC transporter permease subunit [Micromonospora sp. HUAS 3]